MSATCRWSSSASPYHEPHVSKLFTHFDFSFLQLVEAASEFAIGTACAVLSAGYPFSRSKPMSYEERVDEQLRAIRDFVLSQELPPSLIGTIWDRGIDAHVAAMRLVGSAERTVH
jgi:hypothetical protein